MKKLLSITAALFLSAFLFANTPTGINEKVKQAFKQTFSDVKNAEWFDKGSIYQVRFIKNGIDTRVTYDNDANMLKTVRYYDGKQLPPFIQGKLKKRYSNKEVFGVTEINSQAGLEYHITMQDDKNWIVLKADPNGNTEVYKKFKKA